MRVDLYRLKDGQWHYDSSIILEVKYRPLRNIINLDRQGDTQAMEQLNSYRSIGYKYPGGGYNYTPVKMIFCVYPGDNNKDILFPMRYGFMLQFYPQ